MSIEINIGPLSEETQAIAEKELRETPENIKKGLEELKQYLANDPELNFDTDDAFLIIFLRRCKFYAKSAYELMKRISDFKQKHKDLVGHLLPEHVLDIIQNHNLVNTLINRDQKGRRVLIQHGGSSWDPSKVTSNEIFKLLYIMSSFAIVEPETQVRGGVVILDFEGLSTKHVMAIPPATLAMHFNYIQDAMPARIKEIHIVKQPFIFNMIWAIMKNFMNEKTKKRTFFHGNKMSSLHKYIAPSHLPKDYGGDLPKVDHTLVDFLHVLNDHSEHMKKMNACGYAKKDL